MSNNYIHKNTQTIPKERDFRTVPYAKNTIFYGLPGTGKTYRLRKELMPIFTGEKAILTPEQFAKQLTENLTWLEVITLVLIDLAEAKVQQIFAHPLVQAKITHSENKRPKSTIWYHLQKHTDLRCPNVRYDKTKRSEPLYFWKNEKATWAIDHETANQAMPDLAEVLYSFKNYQPVRREDRRYEFITFHQSYSYEEFVEGLKPVLDTETDNGDIRYRIEPGIFRRLVKRAEQNPQEDFALFVDEINRGNLSKIFGELITLLEPDKRAGAANELCVTLPYSKEKFSVPQNIYLFGTMNTADRSAALPDNALRRRFEFIEMLPDPTLPALDREIAGVHLGRLLSGLNARIAHLYDRDHTVGHAYFVEIKSYADLCRLFRNKIIPLLREYFYGDTDKIRLVLADNPKGGKAEEHRFIQQNKSLTSKALFGEEVRFGEEKKTYFLHPALAEEPYRDFPPEAFSAIMKSGE